MNFDENGEKYQLRLKYKNISRVKNNFRYTVISVRVTQ